MSDTYAQPRRVPWANGIVMAQQLTPFPAVRVQFPAHDNMVSYWLPITSSKASASGDFTFSMPDIGDQVQCIMDEHYEQGSVIGSLPSKVDTTPSGASLDNTFYIQTKDGTTLQYNRNTHILSAAFTNAGTVEITMPGGATFSMTETAITMNDGHGGQISINGAVVAVTGTLSVNGTIVTVP